MSSRAFAVAAWGALLTMAGCGPELVSDEAMFEEKQGAAALVAPGSTVITFSFADTLKSQTRAAALLAKYGLHATWYVNSARVGSSSSYLSLADLQSIASAGNEIGGHTRTHTDLTEVSSTTARQEVCDDRVALLQMGFQVTSFDYPFSGDSDAARQIVIDCNYNNARAAGGVRNPFGCSSCPRSESIPPQDVFRIRSPGSITNDYTLSNLQSLVTQVESSGGGWMILGFHKICSSTESCGGTYDVRESLLDSFMAWLAPRSSRGTFVMTTHEVVGGAVKPGVPSSGGGGGQPPGPGAIPLKNASLETDSDGDNVPDCWKRQNMGSTEGGWLRTSDDHSGSWAQRARISSYSSGDRRLVVLQDSGTCAPVGTPGRAYKVSAWYKTDTRAAFVATYRSGGTWRTWVSGPELPRSASTYVRGEWVTPALPAGATHLSIGLLQRGVGYLFMDDFALEGL
jgi:peptidoglycan/xylan/chitin deacetylase (PgdA/CDA1 family)